MAECNADTPDRIDMDSLFLVEVKATFFICATRIRTAIIHLPASTGPSHWAERSPASSADYRQTWNHKSAATKQDPILQSGTASPLCGQPPQLG